MRITYDPEVDALYIRFEEGSVTTKHLSEGIAADIDSKGQLAGIEILSALKRFGGSDSLKKVTLEEIGLSHSYTNHCHHRADAALDGAGGGGAGGANQRAAHG